MKINSIKFNAFVEKTNNTDGIVLLGCGGDLQEWVSGVTKLLKEEKIIKKSPWQSAFLLTTTGGRNDIALVFKKNPELEMGKMAIWRLKFGDCSWISDYVENYRSQHEKE